MTSEAEPHVDVLVADSAAFLRNVQLHRLAKEVVTVQEVIAEIRDPATRSRLQVLPYDLQVREPSDQCLRQVSDFSKKTGDFPFLSATDLKVLALTLQVTGEKIGLEHVRTEPPAPRPTVSVYHPSQQSQTGGQPVGFVVGKLDALSLKPDTCGDAEPATEEGERESAREDAAPDPGDEGGESQSKEGEETSGDEGWETPNEDEEKSPVKETRKSTSEELGQSSVGETGGSPKGDHLHDEAEDDGDGGPPPQHEEQDSASDGDGEDGSEEDSEDEDGWITPANIAAAKTEMNTQAGETEEPVKVACLTTDFSMQNVLKQMGLEIVSVEGRRIRETRRFILRCFGCFQTTPNMEKRFCPRCGNKTLKRVAVTLRPDGTQQIHISSRKPISKRGTKFSLPKPRGGKYAVNPILCEDQPVPHQRPTKRSLARNAVLSEDYVPGASPFRLNDVHSRAAAMGRSGSHRPTHYWERRNPNQPLPSTGNKRRQRRK